MLDRIQLKIKWIGRLYFYSYVTVVMIRLRSHILVSKQ